MILVNSPRNLTKTLILLFIISITFKISAKTEEGTKQAIIQIKKGNLAMEASQQIGPLFAFGQNIVQKNDLQVFAYTDYLNGKRTEYTEIIPNMLYGINDVTSIYINMPIAISFKSNGQHSSGMEDIFAQAEYAVYNKTALKYSNQMTLVSKVTIPTGSLSKQPATGYGSPSIFLGATFSHLAVHWYYFGSAGCTITFPRHNIQAGNQFFYQAGIGRTLFNLPGWLFAWLVEFNGTYSEPEKINLHPHPFGGNIIYIGPSLWISSKRLIIQLGIEFATLQNSKNKKDKSRFITALEIGWKF